MISQLGRYEIICEIGQGAMGTVYKAKDPLIDRMVAVKTINLGLALDEKDEYEGRFYQEARAAGRLNHPNIVTIYDVGKSGDVAYIAMEFLHGSELRDIMNEGRLLPINQALDIAAQVAQGLSYAHEHGIVHRDIKPSNIMVVRDGQVKITDFGIARMASSAIRTQTGLILGSPKYMSPEQVMGKTVDQRSDIFSLGVMLYEMLTGKAPFDGDSVNAIMFQTLKVTPTPLATLNPAAPEMANFIVAKALAKNLDDRYQSARDFAADLRACCDTLLHDGLKNSTSSIGARLLGVIDVSGRINSDEEEVMLAAGLSHNFDSTAATMRLAALTVPGEMDELAKTLKIERWSEPLITQAAPAAKIIPQSAAVSPAAVSSANDQNPADKRARPAISHFILIVAAILIFLSLVAMLVT